MIQKIPLNIKHDVYIQLRLIELSWQQPNYDIHTNLSAYYDKRTVAAYGIHTQPLY